MKLLIDADFIVYKSCAAAETEIDWGHDVIMVTSKFSDAMNAVTREITKIKQKFMWDVPEILLFFSDSINFRKSILSDYKGHRNRKKPCGYKRVINALKDLHEVIIMPTLEADDAMGIYATKHPGNIICSPDKDMRQIPGVLWNLTGDVEEITKEDGDRWHLMQSLAGDPTDGYPGCPGIGMKRAGDLLDKSDDPWKAICKAFKDKGLSEDVALMNARLAKILQHENYDYDRAEPILWNPT